LTLDLRQKEGVEIFKGLVEKTDVVCENFRTGTLEKWGLGWEVLKKINPKLVMLRVAGYGQTGPYKDRPALPAWRTRWADSLTWRACPKARR